MTVSFLSLSNNPTSDTTSQSVNVSEFHYFVMASATAYCFIKATTTGEICLSMCSLVDFFPPF